jgi:hypothetical protein
VLVIASPSLIVMTRRDSVTHITTATEALIALWRPAGILAREGVRFNRSTLSNWRSMLSNGIS